MSSGREMPEWVRKALHDKLDELLNRYERGDPLWIVGHWSVLSRKLNLDCDIYLKDEPEKTAPEQCPNCGSSDLPPYDDADGWDQRRWGECRVCDMVVCLD